MRRRADEQQDQQKQPHSGASATARPRRSSMGPRRSTAGRRRPDIRDASAVGAADDRARSGRATVRRADRSSAAGWPAGGLHSSLQACRGRRGARRCPRPASRIHSRFNRLGADAVAPPPPRKIASRRCSGAARAAAPDSRSRQCGARLRSPKGSPPPAGPAVRHRRCWRGRGGRRSSSPCAGDERRRTPAAAHGQQQVGPAFQRRFQVAAVARKAPRQPPQRRCRPGRATAG